MTSGKEKFLITVVLAGVLVVSVLVFRQTFFSGDNISDNNEEQIQDDSSGQQRIERDTDVLRGVLRASDDPARGNLILMLSNSNTSLYINTSRDFSYLIGFEVLVTIEGAIDSFTLIDVQPRIVGDNGFIVPN